MVFFTGVVALSACTSSTISSYVTPTIQPSGPPAASTVVSNLHDSGAGSLRSAIKAVNAKPAGESYVITFKVGGDIALASNLPPIRRKVKIDGTSAPKYAGAAPTIGIDAANHGALVFASGSDGSQLLAVAVVGAKGNGVTLAASQITLNQNYIGIDVDGVKLGNSGDGVFVAKTSTNNEIGLNASGAVGVVANVISGNGGNGISLHGSSGNTVAANRIGTDPTGKTAVPNAGNGIWITGGSHDNEIGGTDYTDPATGAINDPTGDKGTVTPVFVVPPLGNLLSGNGIDGILVDNGSIDNMFNGNFIGTTADGDSPLGNVADGVHFIASNSNTMAGCKFVNNPFVYYNVSSGNGLNGVHITNSNDVVIQGNFFGIGANNTTPIPNKRDGILVDGSSQNTQVGGVIPLGNVSAGNGRNGIEVIDTASGFITFNTFGGLLAFKGAAPNGNDGILLTATGGNQTIRTNVFSGNANHGIEIGGDASGVTIDPNIVGLTTKGDAILSNGGDGLRLSGTAHDNVIGGNTKSVIPQNTFSGNGGYGVAIVGQAHDNTIFSSFVGTNVAGLAAIGNGKGGIFVGGSATKILIGGPSSSSSAVPSDRGDEPRNLISGNSGDGVRLAAGTSFIAVVNNWIGLDRQKRKLLPNKGRPIVVSPGSTNDTIAGNITTAP
ncbi:MAG TPA: right-handed parallel beta-helix repeat-containing protein [Candidatus Acidoferrales bacterium]|nr:right-handed parallel beta-helix repeat-containing protein [Candidatus Acidoferrales bacterium]